jgi:hypothetical protein
MIRRDYIVRMIEEFCQALSRIHACKKERLWGQAEAAVDEELQRLIGVKVRSALQLSETELLALIIKGTPTLAVRDKTMILSTLLKEAGDVAVAEQRLDEGRTCYLKGLHLLLDNLGRGEDFERPDFVPKVELLVEAVADGPLPVHTQALLMEHYERTAQFAKAEDVLFAMLDTEPDNAGLLRLGIAFYERIEGQSDGRLEAGNLPRTELAAALAGLRARGAQAA